ncbi:hypothetical protein QBC37DRAFT_78006 [Rhypophila decipiens]|uniref:NACHT domain-containing protein n=1 Tax=Rhypophila decipiens TaxID=261697 RepID=A0AAN6YCP3_9PEZI|nr:hypothetical protein QBC37DRAFT_78006 [Rhypophila decipiens]
MQNATELSPYVCCNLFLLAASTLAPSLTARIFLRNCIVLLDPVATMSTAVTMGAAYALPTAEPRCYHRIYPGCLLSDRPCPRWRPFSSSPIPGSVTVISRLAMSGMEPLAVLGLACNAMQIFQFTFESVSLCKKAFRTGIPDPELARYVNECAQLYRKLDNSIRSVQHPNAEDVEFLRICGNTRDASLLLETEIKAILQPTAKGRVRASIIVGFKARIKAHKLDRLEKQMRGYQKILESGLLDRTCKKVDALSLQQDERFNNLDVVLRDFIRSYCQGQRRLEGLLDAHTTSIKALVEAETLKTHRTITDAVQSVSTKTTEDLAVILNQIASEPQIWQKRERLLKSLKYSTMGDRFNQIPQPHDGTYQWIMRGTRLWEQEEEDPDTRISRSSSACAHTNPALDVCWSCFPCWLESTSSASNLYWIQGKTGAGKSTLMKFIVTDPDLWSSLNLADGVPLLLYHFLWAPGGQLQKSVRGLLLALVYQFLSANEKVLDEVISALPKAKYKDIPGDWTLEELQMIIQTWFPRSDRRIVIFIDGLDEMDPDDRSTPDPLRFITTKIATIGKVKLCVSSRPEQLFLRYFASKPTLRLQDITFFDMKIYAEAYLVPDPGDEYDTKDVRNLIDSLLVKADGVFLWIALVVRSLASGLRNGDSIEELNLRLEQMPKGLNALYQDMWARLNDDEPIYRQEAALYFNLIRDWRTLQSGTDEGPREDSDDTIEILGLLLATQPAKAQEILKNPAAFTADQLQAACRDLAKRVERRTARLLHVKERHSGRTTLVEFLHRSSLEFLENTPEGRKILAYDKTPREARFSNLARGFMARIYLRVTGQLDEGLGAFRIQNVLDMISTNFRRGRIVQDDAVELLASAQRLFDLAIRSGVPGKTFGLPGNFKGHDFVRLLAMFGFDDLASLFFDGLVPGWNSNVMDSSLYRSSLVVAALTPPDISMDTLTTTASEEHSHGPEAASAQVQQEKGAKLVTLVSLLCSRTFWPSSLPELSETVAAYKRTGICLAESITLYLEVPAGAPDETVLIISPSSLMPQKYYRPSPRILKGNAWIALEMKVSSLVELVLGAVEASTAVKLPSVVSASSSDAGKANLDLVPRVGCARVLAFYVPYWGSMGAQQPSYFRKILTPATEEDARYVLSGLNAITLSEAEPNAFAIPSLWKRVEEIASRAKEADELMFQNALHGPLDDMVESLMDSGSLTEGH